MFKRHTKPPPRKSSHPAKSRPHIKPFRHQSFPPISSSQENALSFLPTLARFLPLLSHFCHEIIEFQTVNRDLYIGNGGYTLLLHCSRVGLGVHLALRV
jgi:hypothetical protein